MFNSSVSFCLLSHFEMFQKQGCKFSEINSHIWLKVVLKLENKHNNINWLKILINFFKKTHIHYMFSYNIKFLVCNKQNKTEWITNFENTYRTWFHNLSKKIIVVVRRISRKTCDINSPLWYSSTGISNFKLGALEHLQQISQMSYVKKIERSCMI